MAETVCRSFPPCARRGARVLILGSMPGEESLRQRQYYAFPRNAFWQIIGTVCAPDGGARADEAFAARPYRERLRVLTACGFALWDVLENCERAGSLDAAIRAPKANDIPGLLKRFPSIRRICCNGGTAGRYLRRFFPELAPLAVILPSTSPAAAMYSYAEKLARWQAALCP